ncbi:hypothetical protein MTR67_030491 [Solanum verrucosum]|uniref:Uncharacterized protein n=1 Tax=Solanum verrucosum TaxID=315347 RepID=A0AAF0RE04_SOLVR|nr:hypothetical protein MTR67_030491 [Solanum verrucosum]
MLWELQQLRGKSLPIEDIDKIIVAISELMEIMKMLHKAFSSHDCAAADFVDSKGNSPCAFTFAQVIQAKYVVNELVWLPIAQYKIKCLLDVFEIGKRYIVLVTFLEKLSLNECKLLEVGFVGAGRIWFKLVEKVVVPRSAFQTTEILQVPVPSFHNILVELDPTILNAP